MAIVTKAQVKTFLQFSDNNWFTYDDLIDALIPIVEADYERIRNREFDDDSSDEIEYPTGAEYTAAQMIGYRIFHQPENLRGKQSESIGKYSYTKEEMFHGYPKSIVGNIKRYVKIK